MKRLAAMIVLVIVLLPMAASGPLQGNYNRVEMSVDYLEHNVALGSADTLRIEVTGNGALGICVIDGKFSNIATVNGTLPWTSFMVGRDQDAACGVNAGVTSSDWVLLAIREVDQDVDVMIVFLPSD